MEYGEVLMEIKDLSVDYKSSGKAVHAVRNLNLSSNCSAPC